MANEIKHYDKLGTELVPGDYIHAPNGNRNSVIAQVIKLNPKMLTIKVIGARRTTNAYPSETVKLDTNLVTMYILRNEK